MAKDSIEVGKRYVFFTSLSFPNPNDTLKRQQQLQNLGKAALNKLTQIDKLLTGTNNNEQSELSLIDEYINFLQQQADALRKNELLFVQQQLKLLSQLQNQKTSQYLQEIMNSLIAIQSGEDFDYLGLLELLNSLLIPSKERLNLLQIQKNNIEIIKKNYQQATQEEQQTIIKTFLYNYEDYRTQHAKILTQAVDNIPFQQTVSEQIADKINAVISRFSRVCPDELKEQIKNQYMTDKPLSDTQIKNILIPLITQVVLQDSSLKTDEIVNNVISNITTQIKQVYNENAMNIFFIKTQKSLEELAMKKEGYFEGLADAFLQLTEGEQNAVIDKYQIPVSTEFINNLKTNKTASLKAEFTRKAGLAIQHQLQQIISTKIEEPEKSFNNIQDFFNKNKKNFIIERQLNEDLQTQLKVTRVKSSGIDELLAAKDVKEQLKAVALSKVPGNIINLKDDIQFIIEFQPKEGAAAGLNTQLLNNLNELLVTCYENFLPSYKQITIDGRTDVNASRTALAAQFDKIGEELTKAGYQEEETYELLKNLQKSIIGGISVKDYNLYNDELGFHGGSLGAGKAADSVIDNVMAMYEQGGITKIDTDSLIFAAINCSTYTYGDKSILQHLSNFLLGGAALLMFDEDFGLRTFELLKNQIAKEIWQQTAGVTIYKLNTIYVPASYVLQTIHDQLVPIYNDIVTNFYTAPKSNYVQIQTHNLTPKDIPDPKNMPDFHDRWQAISEMAMSQTKIQFLFMAGLLDIITSLEYTFKNPIYF